MVIHSTQRTVIFNKLCYESFSKLCPSSFSGVGDEVNEYEISIKNDLLRVLISLSIFIHDVELG